MSGKNQWVVPINGGDQWGVRGEGNDRLTSIHDTQQQAIDRAYRIGQKKNVFVYKTIAKGSIEEKIVKLQEQKKGLVSDIITTDENVFKQLTTVDFEGLFE